MPRETVINPPTRGAGRTIDLAFPAPQNFVNAAANPVPGVVFNRQTFTTNTWGGYSTFGVPPAGSGWQMYRGRICWRQTGGGTSGGFWTTETTGTLGITFPQSKLAAPFNNDYACWRLLAILAFDTGLGAGDTGLEIGPQMQANYNIFSGNFPGIRIGPTSDTTAAIQVRQNDGGVLTINQTIATNINTLDWNAYEVRLIGATDKRDAVMKVFFNGVRVFQASWGAGTLLPGFLRGTSAGYGIGLGNRGANGVYIPLCGLQIAAGPTEDALF